MSQDGAVEAAFYSAFGARLRVLREARQMSQGGLAVELGVHRNTICRWEQGESAIDLWLLMRVADVLSIPHEQLLPARRLVWGESRYIRERDRARLAIQRERDPELQRKEIA